MRQPHGGEHMQAMHLVLPLQIGLEELAPSSEARVVHQQLQVPGGRQALLHHLHSGIACQICREDLDVHLVRLGQIAGPLLQPVLPPGHQNQVVPAGRQLGREFRADAAGGASNQSEWTHAA